MSLYRRRPAALERRPAALERRPAALERWRRYRDLRRRWPTVWRSALWKASK